MRYSSINIKLSCIADIFTGFNYKKNNISFDNNDVNFIQAKDIIDNKLNKESILKISKDLLVQKFILKNNDILFSAKGSRKFAFLYKSIYGLASASSTFFIIRITDKNILPAFLSWYLNQKPAQDYIKSQSKGTFISSINIKQISEIDVPMPAIETQEKIIEIDSLRKKEKELINVISNKKDILIENILYKKIKE